MLKRVTNWVIVLTCVSICASCQGTSRFEFEAVSDHGPWTVAIDGNHILTYVYDSNTDLPHYCPLLTPSGKNLLIQKTTPYPHHRAFWFGDTVRLEGTERKISMYNSLYTGTKSANEPRGKERAPFADYIQHQTIGQVQIKDDQAIVEKTLVWRYDHEKPIIDEHRHMRIKALGQGEYLLDITFTLTANYGDVHVVSDKVHYAWPYLRINPIFSGEQGGTITNDSGATGQKGTHDKVAKWIDYSNTVEGVTEGLTIFQWPDGHDHRWLTREYGTFGPRRKEAHHGKKFTIKKGDTLQQRVGILVHCGDVQTGKVAERYQAYVDGQL